MVRWKKDERFHIFIGQYYYAYFLHFMDVSTLSTVFECPHTHQWLTELLRKVNCALLQKCTHPFRFVPFKPKEILFRGGGLIWLHGNFGHVLLGKSGRFFRILWPAHNIWTLLALIPISSVNISVVLWKKVGWIRIQIIFVLSLVQKFHVTVLLQYS